MTLLTRCTLISFLFFAGLASAKSPDQIFAENRNAVVRVEVARPGSQPTTGSGFIIGHRGYVLTAKHVVAAFKNNTETPITVRIGSLDAQPISAELLPAEVGIDVTMLKLRPPASLNLNRYQTVKRGNAETITNGRELFVIGFPLNYNIGIYPAPLSSDLGGGSAGNLLWQLAAPGVVFGTSGAPVFDNEGRVVGIVTGGPSGTSLAYAYPEDLLEFFAAVPAWRRDSEVVAAGSPSATAAGGTTASVSEGFRFYGRSGYSFEQRQVVPWDSPNGDLLVAAPGGGTPTFFMPFDAPPFAGEQDRSAKSGLYPIGKVPLESISSCPTGGYGFHWTKVEADVAYCVRSRNGLRYYKVKVRSVETDKIVFDWQPA